MTELLASETRCTLCSLACALGFERTPGGRVLPEYPKETRDLRGGICGRGHLNYEMLAHPLRLEQPLVRRGGKLAPTPLPHLVTELSRVLEAGPTLIVVDGSLACEDVAAAGKFAGRLGGRASWTVYLDPGDEAMLAGVAASGAKLLTPEELAGCDAVLCVGDAFGTHPVISRPVHAVRRQDPRRMFAAVDSVRTRTSKLATTFVQVKAGQETAVLRFLAGEIAVEPAAEASGVEAGTLGALAAGLGKAQKLGVVIAAEAGKATDWEAAGVLCGMIAQKQGGGVTPLPTGGNAWGAYGVARTLGAMPLAEAVRRLAVGEYKAVALLGVELAEELPAAGLAEGLKRAGTLVVATSMQPLPEAMGTHFLPMATNVEVTGTVVDGSGEVVELREVMKPAGGAMSVRALVEAVRPGVGEEAADPKWLVPGTEASAAECLSAKPARVDLKEGELAGVGESGCVHRGAGSMSRRMSWPQVFEARPRVRMAKEDAEARSLRAGDTVRVRSARGTAEMVVVVEKGQRAGQAGLWTHSAEVRGLFEWNAAGRRVIAGPIAVKIEKA